MKKRVLVTQPFPGERIEVLGRHCELQTWPGPGPMPPRELRQHLPGCHGLVCLITDRIDEETLRLAPELEFVSSMSVGVDHIAVDALTARGIPVGYTPGVLVETTADLAFALILASARRVAEADRYVRRGDWGRETAWSPMFFTGKDVWGATLGIVGLGAIGQAVARRARGFGMSVLAWSRTPKGVEGVAEVSLEELLGNSDFVSLHVALTPETRNLLDADRLAAMKPGAVLVNTARGGLVDEQALASALSSGSLYAAGLDVFEQEPVPPGHPLLGLPNVVVAPHIGSASEKTRQKMADMAADNALAALRGGTMPSCYNPEVYGRR